MRGTSLSRLLLPSAIWIAMLAGIGVPTAPAAAQSRIPDRITAAVSDSSPVEIPGSVHPGALHATDLGPVPGDTRLTGMSIRFTPSAAQQAALDQLLADLQDPASPRYHQWLTPQQYAAQFGLSAGDLAKITAWLEREGFVVTGVAQGGTFITFDGTVAQAQTAFSTSIHSLSVNGETHFANVTNISVPSAFAGVVGAVTGLHDFRPKPHLHTSVVQPHFTSDQTGNHFLAPGDVYTIYDSQPLLSAGTNGSGIGTGANCHSVPSGTTCGDIAVMGVVDLGTPTAASNADVIAFRSAAGLSTSNLPTTVHAGLDPGLPHNCSPAPYTNCQYPNLLDLEEASLDVEWSGAMAPSASILFVNGDDIFSNSMTYAIDQNVAPIISTSYGLCEAGEGSSTLNIYNQLFKEANAQGQTILAASGDSGATDCDPDTGTSAVSGLAVDFPASSPYVTGMGGTMFNGDAEATGNGSTWSTTQYWTGTSGSDVISSARSYIPEAAWNNATYGEFGGGGGGASSFYAKPAWQVETGAAGMTTQVSPDGARDVPDLALSASPLHDGYLICYDGSCVSGFRTSNGNLNAAGGTSCDAPVFSGMLALIEQKIGSRIGNANPLLYALGNNATYYNTTTGSVFHDVTAGGNAMPCTEGTTACPNGGTIGYSAGTGYDLATGWGSVDLNNLASAWSWAEAHPESLGSLGPNLSTTALAASSSTSSATNVPAGTTDTLTATVSGATIVTANPLTTTPGPTPTGMVQFLINNVALGSPVALVAGVASTPFLTSCSSLGQQSVTAVYSGDSNYQGSIGPVLTVTGSGESSDGGFLTNPLIITVTPGPCPNFTVNSSAPLVSGVPTISVASGGTIPAATITATSANAFTGTVAFTSSVEVTAGDSAGVTPGISLSPTSVTLSANGSATTSLTLSGIVASLRLPSVPGQFDSGTMLAQQAPGRVPSPNRPWTLAGSGVTLACLLLLVLPRRRRLGGLLLLAFSVALAVGTNGCGGSSQAGPPSTTTSTNPYAGIYVVTVTGTYTGSPALPPQSTTVTYVIN